MNTLVVIKNSNENIDNFLLKNGCRRVDKDVYLIEDIVKATVLARKIYKEYPETVNIKGFRVTDEYNLSKQNIAYT